MKNLSKWLAGTAMFCAVMHGFAAGAMAAPYSVTYTDTVSGGDPTLPAGVNLGEQVRAEFILNNGNSSVANQTWTAADLKCVIFTFNNAQDKYIAVSYSSKPLSTSETIGNFVTNGSGQLLAGSIDWADFPVLNPQKTNIAGLTSFDDWVFDGSNGVFFWNGYLLGIDLVNVANDNQVTNWSNPVPSNGVCLPASPAPAMANQTLVFLGAGLLMAGLWSVRRLAARRN